MGTTNPQKTKNVRVIPQTNLRQVFVGEYLQDTAHALHIFCVADV